MSPGWILLPKAIRIAKSKFKKAGFQGQFILADISSLEMMENHFDLILDIGCYHRLHDHPESTIAKSLSGY